MSKIKKKKEEKKEVESAPTADVYEFDVWWVMRRDRMPKHHMKEVIKADFMARGVNSKDTLENFDKALEKYGIKLQ